MGRGMRTFAATLAVSALLAGPALAQDDAAAEDDTVFDNTKKNEELAQKRAKERREKYQGDSPFAADEAPDPVEKREDRFSPGVEGGYRAGWAFPGGEIAEGFFLDTAGMLFLQGDGGYRFIPQLFVGIYLSAGYIIPDCAENVTCRLWDFRGGVQGQWRFLPFADYTPWVGVGAGYELLLASASTETTDQSGTMHGFELFMVQGGLDIWAPTARGHVGIFVAYSRGRFSSFGGDFPDLEAANHSWLFLGVRGTF